MSAPQSIITIMSAIIGGIVGFSMGLPWGVVVGLLIVVGGITLDTWLVSRGRKHNGKF